MRFEPLFPESLQISSSVTQIQLGTAAYPLCDPDCITCDISGLVTTVGQFQKAPKRRIMSTNYVFRVSLVKSVPRGSRCIQHATHPAQRWKQSTPSHVLERVYANCPVEGLRTTCCNQPCRTPGATTGYILHVSWQSLAARYSRVRTAVGLLQPYRIPHIATGTR